MNKIYKVIWSKTRNCYVAVSELAKSHTKGCSLKRMGRVLAAGAVVAGIMLPMEEAEAFSSSYVPSYSSSSGYSSQDYMTDGGHVDVSQIGGWDPESHNYYYYVYVNNDGTVNFNKNENYQKNDISSMIGNVAIGNFAEAGSAADAKQINFYNYSSWQVAYEVKPETGSWYSTNFKGKTYWYAGNSSDRRYAYTPTYNYGGSVIEKDGKYYHQIQEFTPTLDDQGNWQYDTNGNPIGKMVSKFAEIGSTIWKKDPNNPNGNLIIDYKSTDEYGNPTFNLTAENLGLNDDNAYGDSGGTNNVAVGNKSKTVSHSSVAVGDTSTARGWRSIAIGAQSEAGADPETTYVGSWNDGTSAVAVGNSAKAYGSTSVAVGNGSQTYSFSGVAVGNGANASTEYAIAIGDNARVAYVNGAGDIEQQRTAAQSIAIGRDALAQAKDVTAVGRNAQGMMRNATAYGNNAHANGWNSIAIGNKATAGLQAEILKEDGTAKDGAIANSAIAIGNRARATAEYTTAIGAGTNAEGWHAVAVGDSNQATGKFSTAIGAGWSINHTEGEPDSDDATDGSDAINTEGTRTYESIGANQAGGDYSTAAGYGNKTVGTQSNAFGKENEVSGLSSLGVGAGNKVGAVAVGDDGILVDDQENTVSGYAVGSYNTITGSEGSNAGAFGAGNEVAGDNGYAVGNFNIISKTASGGIAMGIGNTVQGEQSIAVGTGHVISGNNSGAFGDPSYIKDDNAYAIGNNNTIEEGSANTFIVGNNVKTTAENTVVFGHHTENNAHTFGQNSVSLGTDAQATIGDSVALGSTSVAKRAAANGNAGAGYDVRTGTNYAEEDAKSPTWVSTLGAVSVGGTEKDTDAAIGSAATATRQITGVAAGTADTDAVNVAQLKLAVGGTTYTEGDNITIDENNVISATDTTYTATQSVEPGEKPGEGSTTLIIRDSNKDEKNPDGTPVGSMTIEAGDNITITEGDDNKAIISATDTTYNYNVTEDGLEEGQVSKLTIVNNVTGETVGEFVDTNTHASVVGKGAVTVEMTKEATATAGPEYTVSLDTDLLKDTTYTAEQSVTAGENPGEGSTTFTITDSNGDEAGSMIIKAGDKVTITEEKDEKGNSIAVINAQDTTYKISEEAGEEGSNVVNNYTMTGTNGDKYTFKDTDTTYKISAEAGEKGSGVVNTYTMTGTNGDKYTFEDTDTDTTYKIEEKREKKGTVAATYTVTDSNNNKVGEIQDTHNGLTGDTYKVEYDENGVGSVTIEDQDGNKATITNIQSGGEGIADSINYLGDRINNLDKKINKVGAGAAALAGLHPLDFDPDEKWDFSAAAGSYKGEHAVAIGAFYRPNEDTMFSVGGTIGNGNNMVNVGVSWKFGQKNRISANRISSAKEIIELRKNQEDVHSFLADAVAGNQLDLSKIQLFPDVEENHWAYDYVATMAGNGVLEGYPDGYFKGNRNMTRYEMAAVLYRLMQNGARLSDRALTEFAPELDRIRVDTITKHKDGTPHIQRVRTIKERVDEKADPSSKKETKKKAKIKVAEKPVE